MIHLLILNIFSILINLVLGKTVNRILEIKPQIVIIQWAIAIQGIPLNYVIKN